MMGQRRGWVGLVARAGEELRRPSARHVARVANATAAPSPRAPGAGLLVAMVLVAAAYFVPRGISWNEDSHLFLTASIVDRGALDIDPLASYTGDIASVHGHFYSDKAPGLSLLAVPVYALLKYALLGGRPLAALYALPETQRVDFLVRYLLALVYAGVPTAIVTVLLYRFLPRLGVGVRWSAALALTYGLGTIALPFSSRFFSHQLAAALIFGAFVLLYRVRHGELASRYTLLVGGLLGCAVITEYPTALLVLALVVYGLDLVPTSLAARGGVNRRRSALLLAVGAAPALLVGAVYNTLAFGGPLSTGYAHLAGP